MVWEWLGLVNCDKIISNMKPTLRGILYFAAIGLCVYTLYVPVLYLRSIGWKAMEMYFSLGKNIIANSDVIRTMILISALCKIIFPLSLLGISIIVKKFLRMEKLQKICVISSAVGTFFTLLFLFLGLINFQFYEYPEGLRVMVGWIFVFYAVK